MTDLQIIRLKTKYMLKPFNKKGVDFYFMSFKCKKLGLKERQALRQELVKKLKQKITYVKNFNNLLTVGVKPDSSFASITISHCKNIGAFLFVLDKNLGIGFDIEKTHRVKQKVIKRVSTVKEIKLSPHPALLWTAKEAVFKALFNKKEALLLSECQITDWKKSSPKGFYSFKSTAKGKKAVGRACFAKDLALAYAESKTRRLKP